MGVMDYGIDSANIRVGARYNYVSKMNPYSGSIKELALVAGVSCDTVARRLRANVRIQGVRIRFIKDGETKPRYRIHKDSIAALRMRVSA